MHAQDNFCMMQRRPLRLVSQYLHGNRTLHELAAEKGISLRCVYKWLTLICSGSVISLIYWRCVCGSLRRSPAHAPVLGLIPRV
jgi:hypothetical protein